MLLAGFGWARARARLGLSRGLARLGSIYYRPLDPDRVADRRDLTGVAAGRRTERMRRRRAAQACRCRLLRCFLEPGEMSTTISAMRQGRWTWRHGHVLPGMARRGDRSSALLRRARVEDGRVDWLRKIRNGGVRKVLHGKGRRMVLKKRRGVVSINRNRARTVADVVYSGEINRRSGGVSRVRVWGRRTGGARAF